MIPDGWGPLWYFAILLLAGLLGWLVAWCFSEPMNRRLRAGARVVPAD
jgi:peptidoglycan/LPS O-acetylase OafA/YrhL